MTSGDTEQVLKLRSVVSRTAEPDAFGLLLGMRDARWAVAERKDGAIVGMVGAVPLGRVGILCHLAVHDEHRRRGLGAGLVSWAVTYLRSRGTDLIRLYSTPRAVRLYRSMGFVPTSGRTVYRLEEATAVPQTYVGGYRVETLLFGDVPEVLGADYWAYGADRSALILAALRLHPGRGLVARDSTGRVRGYLVRSSSGRETRIGPLVAASDDVARLLLTRGLSESAGSPVRLLAAGDGPAHGLMQEMGFEGRRDRLYMERGRMPALSDPGLTRYATTAYLAT
jgi:predicted GNAT family acetyltransferase